MIGIHHIYVALFLFDKSPTQSMLIRINEIIIIIIRSYEIGCSRDGSSHIPNTNATYKIKTVKRVVSEKMSFRILMHHLTIDHMHSIASIIEKSLEDHTFFFYFSYAFDKVL